ncbi:unnamed protein product [Blepharisma stoltei]|uniref:Uncharacterized protein n=1 Tax=Blepharisma stoltei TaxID=1481888 RepID=A0AAU9ITA3_9CILI|nr:unnamed protein product [Blepharisma stoltei]
MEYTCPAKLQISIKSCHRRASSLTKCLYKAAKPKNLYRDYQFWLDNWNLSYSSESPLKTSYSQEPDISASTNSSINLSNPQISLTNNFVMRKRIRPKSIGEQTVSCRSASKPKIINPKAQNSNQNIIILPKLKEIKIKNSWLTSKEDLPNLNNLAILPEKIRYLNIKGFKVPKTQRKIKK